MLWISVVCVSRMGSYWSLTPTLPCSSRVMKYDVFIIWGSLGHATWCSGVLASCSGKFNKHWAMVIWSMIPHCLMWDVWREINALTFEENERSIHDLKLSSFKLCLSGHILQVFLPLIFCMIYLIFLPSLLVSLDFFANTIAHYLCALFFFVVSSHLFFNEVLYFSKKGTNAIHFGHCHQWQLQ